MKFLVPNYSCLQNPWLGGYRLQIPVLSVLNWICWTPPQTKFLGMPLQITTVWRLLLCFGLAILLYHAHTLILTCFMLSCVKYILYIFISFVELCLSSLCFCCNFCAIALVAVFMVWLILQVMSMKTKWKKAGLSHPSLVASCQSVRDTSGRYALERLWKWLKTASRPLALLKDQIPNHKPFVYLNMCTSLVPTAYLRVRKYFNAVGYNCMFCSGFFPHSRLMWRFFN